MNKFLLVGLGNIGSEYHETRHNIGFEVLDYFVKKNEADFRVDKLAFVAELTIKGKKIICIKPTTYMNLSGKAFKYWMDKEKVSIENTLTIVDDLALPLNKLRVRPTGSDGGHNGLKDIQLILQTDKYPKLRFGIGNNYPKGMQANFVLGKWEKEEIPTVQQKIIACYDIIWKFLFEGIDSSMQLANNQQF